MKITRLPTAEPAVINVMKNHLSKKVHFIAIATLNGEDLLTGRDKRDVRPEDVIGHCPAFTELTWSMLLNSLRMQQGCTWVDRLPDDFGDEIRSKEAFLGLFPEHIQPQKGGVDLKNEHDCPNVLVEVTRRDLRDMPDNWQTVRTVMAVLKLVDRRTHDARVNDKLLRQNPFDEAVSYFGGAHEAAV